MIFTALFKKRAAFFSFGNVFRKSSRELQSLTVKHSRMKRKMPVLAEYKLKPCIGAIVRFSVKAFVRKRIKIIAGLFSHLCQIAKQLFIGQNDSAGVVGIIHSVLMKIGFFITGIARIKKPCVSRMQRVINISPCGAPQQSAFLSYVFIAVSILTKFGRTVFFIILHSSFIAFSPFIFALDIISYCFAIVNDLPRENSYAGQGQAPCPAMNVVILPKSRINKKTEISQTSVFLFFTMLSGKREALSRSTGVTSNASAISKNTSIENP